MKMTRACGKCRVYGNQYGHYFQPCPRHGALIEHACRQKGITPQQLVDDALEEFVHRYHPDFKRWIA